MDRNQRADLEKPFGGCTRKECVKRRSAGAALFYCLLHSISHFQRDSSSSLYRHISSRNGPCFPFISTRSGIDPLCLAVYLPGLSLNSFLEPLIPAVNTSRCQVTDPPTDFPALSFDFEKRRQAQACPKDSYLALSRLAFCNRFTWSCPTVPCPFSNNDGEAQLDFICSFTWSHMG